MDKYFVFDMNSVLKRRMDYERLVFLLKDGLSMSDFLEIYYDRIQTVETGKITDDEFYSYIIDRLDLNYTVDEIKAIFKRCFNTIYEESLNVILKLKEKGYKVCLFSSLKKTDYEWFKEMFDVSLFDKLYLSYEIGYDKSDVASFEYLVEDLRVKPSNIYFFDDRLTNVENARSVGINGYQVTGETIEDVFIMYNLYNV